MANQFQWFCWPTNVTREGCATEQWPQDGPVLQGAWFRGMVRNIDKGNVTLKDKLIVGRIHKENGI